MLARKMFPMARRGVLGPFDTLREEMDRLFNEWLGETDAPALRYETPELSAYVPRIDVVEGDKELRVTAELPGLEDKDVEVELRDDRLLLRGNKMVATEQKGDTFYRRERRFGAFLREIALPWTVDADQVKAEATFKNGILHVVVPKPKEAAVGRRKIAIKAG